MSGLPLVSSEISVATTGTALAAINPARKYFSVQNKGITNLHVSFVTQGGASVGVLVVPGATYEPKIAPTSAVFGRATTAAVDVTVVTGE